MAKGTNSYIRKHLEVKLRSNMHICAYCKRTSVGWFEIDHIIPPSRGGNSKDYNLTIACNSCNSSKGNKVPDEWVISQMNLRWAVYEKGVGYIHRMRNSKRRGTLTPDIRVWLINKINLNRQKHSYHSAVIGSIKRKTYYIHG